MPKFKITSRGGSTLTKIGAALKGTYSGTTRGGERLTQEAISKATFTNGVYSLENWPRFDVDIMNADSLMLTLEADIPEDQEFYVSTTLQYKLTKVKFIDPKSGKEGLRIEGLPDAVTIVLTEVPRTRKQQAERVLDIKLVLQNSLKAKLARKK